MSIGIGVADPNLGSSFGTAIAVLLGRSLATVERRLHDSRDVLRTVGGVEQGLAARRQRRRGIEQQLMLVLTVTGVTTGSLLRSVRYLPNGAVTDSIVMRSKTGTVRWTFSVADAAALVPAWAAIDDGTRRRSLPVRAARLFRGRPERSQRRPPGRRISRPGQRERGRW